MKAGRGSTRAQGRSCQGRLRTASKAPVTARIIRRIGRLSPRSIAIRTRKRSRDPFRERIARSQRSAVRRWSVMPARAGPRGEAPPPRAPEASPRGAVTAPRVRAP